MPEPPKDLHQVAPTLTDLKKLAPEEKDRLLLAKLAWMSRNDSNVLNKRNLTLPNDPYGLAKGYQPQEKREVIEHLLGAPWARLINAGHLVDLSGQGFHTVSAEGHDFIDRPADSPVAAAATRVHLPLPARIPGRPRVFISYSWDSNGHVDWVEEFAKRLTKNGIQAIFDRWHLQPGQEKTYFMDQGVVGSDFVVIVCTTTYATKANNRLGGAGYESMIITGELAKGLITDKYIPVLRQGSFDTSLPTYLAARIGVNLSGNPYSEAEYEKLLRQLHGEPVVAPPIGEKPDFATGSWRLDAKSTATTPAIEESQQPTEPKPNAASWARYDKPGQANAWMSSIIRIWNNNRYSLELLLGNKIVKEQFFATKQEVIDHFEDIEDSLIRDGYVRMNFTPGSDPDFRSIK